MGRVLGTITVSIPTLQVLPQQFSETRIASTIDGPSSAGHDGDEDAEELLSI